MLYDISDVCRLFGLTPTSIRKYEEMGLIEPRRSASNKRKYSEKERWSHPDETLAPCEG